MNVSDLQVPMFAILAVDFVRQMVTTNGRVFQQIDEEKTGEFLCLIDECNPRPSYLNEVISRIFSPNSIELIFSRYMMSIFVLDDTR